MTNIGRTVLNATDNYVVADATMNPEQGTNTSFPVALISKIDDLGVWRKHNVITGPNANGAFTELLESAKISKDEKIAVMMFRDESDTGIVQNQIKVTNLQNNSTVTFNEYLGVFIDRIIGKVEIKSSRSQTKFTGNLVCPNNHTIIIQKEAFELDFLERKFGGNQSNVFHLIMVYRFQNQVWFLDQVLLSPNFKGHSATTEVSSFDAVGKWLAVGHTFGEGQEPYPGRSEGYVDLFKYNGKNYEYVTVFTPEVVRKLVKGGVTFDSPFPNESDTRSINENFGVSIKFLLNKNGDPMIAVVATRSAEEVGDIASNRTDGRVYVITKHPQKEEFLLDNIHTPLPHVALNGNSIPFDLLDLNNKVNDSLALSKNAMAFHRDNGRNDDSIEIVKINIQGTPSRIYEKDLFWSGMLQKNGRTILPGLSMIC